MRLRAPVRLARLPLRGAGAAAGGARPSVWRYRLGFAAVIALNLLCAGYVSSMFLGGGHSPWALSSLLAPAASARDDLRLRDVGDDGAVVVRDVLVTLTAEQEEIMLLDNVDRALRKGKGEGPIVVKTPHAECAPHLYTWPLRTLAST
jgi:hypothetical protein